MKKLATVLLILFVAGSLFAGSKKEKSSGGTLIGIALPEDHDLRWIKDGNLLRADVEKHGYRAAVQWCDANQDQQNQQIRGFLTQKAKALIIASVNAGVAPVVAEAAKDKVVVVAYDRIIQNSADYDYFITFNNFKVGALQAQSIEMALNLPAVTAAAPKLIALFAGPLTDSNTQFFFDGAMSVLEPYIEKGVLKVIGPHPTSSADTENFQQITMENLPATAKTRMEHLLSNEARNVTLDAILAPNDTLACAIIEACKADAKYRTRLPVISGQDAEFDSMMSIKNGEQYSTVFKDTAKLAEAAVILADAILKGQTPHLPDAVLASGDLRGIGNTGTKYVNAYLIDPILITRDNLNVPVDAGFYDDAHAAQLR